MTAPVGHDAGMNTALRIVLGIVLAAGVVAKWRSSGEF
jgi:hypothetical protein